MPAHPARRPDGRGPAHARARRGHARFTASQASDASCFCSSGLLLAFEAEDDGAQGIYWQVGDGDPRPLVVGDEEIDVGLYVEPQTLAIQDVNARGEILFTAQADSLPNATAKPTTRVLVVAVPVPPEGGCPEDTNGDGNVDVDDLVAVILAWGTADRCADVNGDGFVNVDDLVALILAWGPCAGGG